ncbi:hypothetical protein Pcinc_001631 [Petrolisthes cinctipes]|uniref:Tektin n=1 Tax=Petrolisthes cinctipes TaxID=88211 RepID=A0AAE1G8M0_PETCI|nr:hypothetical protein Pcinc_007391 [Petrolisthes cinctipes]KAK3894653.1 hypothetical protein Pcinc_001631 [Petrolisthes cinctipes]
MLRIEKPVSRHQPDSWVRNNESIRQASRDVRNTSHTLRHHSHHLRDQTSNKTWWDNSDSTTRLDDRCYEMQRVICDLQHSLSQVREEIKKLEKAKEVAEGELEARFSPLNTALQCLTLRERRREGDLVKDDVEISLHDEVRMLEKSRADLEKVVLSSVSHLRSLNQARQTLLQDLSDKQAALDIDKTQEDLTEHSPQISFKPDSLRVPSGSILPAAWLEHSLTNMTRTEAAIKESQGLRDTICVTIQTTKREDETQQTATEYSLRCRLHQESRARDELQWQKERLMAEIKDQEKEISALETQLQASSLPLKVAQTRLEGRTARRGQDLVRDAAQDGLAAEVTQLTQSRTLLRQQLALALDALHSLQRHLRAVDVDLGRKSLSVSLEKKVQDTRQALKQAAPLQSLTEANLTITGSLRAHPTQIL